MDEETRIHQEEEQRRMNEEQLTADAPWPRTRQYIVFGTFDYVRPFDAEYGVTTNIQYRVQRQALHYNLKKTL